MQHTTIYKYTHTHTHTSIKIHNTLKCSPYAFKQIKLNFWLASLPSHWIDIIVGKILKNRVGIASDQYYHHSQSLPISMPFSLGISTILSSLHISLPVNNFRCDPGWRWFFLSTFLQLVILAAAASACAATGGSGGGRGICVIAIVTVLIRKKNSCECLYSIARSFWNFVWITRLVCFSLWNNQMPSSSLFSLAHFVYFLVRFFSFIFLPLLHSATLFRCHSMMDIGDILHGISFTPMCYCSMFWYRFASLEFSTCVSTQAHIRPHTYTTHTWYASFTELWIPISFTPKCSIYVIFVSKIEMDDWMDVNLEKCR